MKHFTKGLCALTALLAVAGGALAQSDADVPDRTDGDGPYDRLVLRGGYLIDGSGAPTQGPVDIVIENDRIAEVRVVGAPKLDIDAERRPAAGTREIDVSGKYILPGFVNLHSHIHTLQDGQGTPPDYIFKLHLAHGITTIREVANSKPTAWLADLRERSERDEIAAPRIYPFTAFSPSESNPLNTPEQAREFIRDIKRDGGVGVKFFGAPEEILWAALDEAGKQGLRTTMHHAQLAVTHANVLDTSGHGLNSMEHWYGLPEAMFDDQVIQNYSPDYIYQDEQNRFGEAGKLWTQAADPYSERWEEVMETLLERDFGIIPTFTIYSASRDWMRSRNADWHDDYTLPSLWDFFRPDRHAHGSYWFDWGTEEEVAWRENFDLWMTFINEYKNRGGKVGVGSDAGYIYQTYGFGYIQEMEMLREAGFHPLEVLRAATQTGAEIIGAQEEIGTVQVGKKADLVIVAENPLANLKVLYGTGHIKLNDETGEVVRVGGVETTIKNGVVYDAAALRADIHAMVSDAKTERGLPEGPMPIVTQGE